LSENLARRLLKTPVARPHRVATKGTFLADRHLPGLRQLEIEASNGTVTLRGRVRSFYEKQLCQNVSRRVSGVVQFVDAVVVA
jgi:osmotically-inducible protein OsmY